MLVWIVGEILEMFIYLFIGGQGILGNYQTQDKLYNIIILTILLNQSLRKVFELCMKSIFLMLSSESLYLLLYILKYGTIQKGS